MAAVDDAGFEALLLSQGNLESLSLKLGGVSTASDVTLVEIALRRVPGVSKALVSLPGGTVEVWYDGSATGPRDLIKAVERAAPTEQDDYSAELAGGTGNDGGAGAANQRELAYW